MTAEFTTVFTTVFIILSVLSVVSFFVCFVCLLFWSRPCVYYDGKARSFFFKRNAERYKAQIIEERKRELEEFKKKIGAR